MADSRHQRQDRLHQRRCKQTEHQTCDACGRHEIRRRTFTGESTFRIYSTGKSQKIVSQGKLRRQQVLIDGVIADVGSLRGQNNIISSIYIYPSTMRNFFIGCFSDAAVNLDALSTGRKLHSYPAGTNLTQLRQTSLDRLLAGWNDLYARSIRYRCGEILINFMTVWKSSMARWCLIFANR
jgi:hypothetical protein